MRKKRNILFLILLVVLVAASPWIRQVIRPEEIEFSAGEESVGETAQIPGGENASGDTSAAIDIPPYAGTPVIVLNDNLPRFPAEEITEEPFVTFTPLDDLGRTGAGTACLDKAHMGTEEREPVNEEIHPSGWHTARYEDRIEDVFLFNRCHVIGYQLCGDPGTAENLFTGTRYLNIETMLAYENEVAHYLRRTKTNHVMYRVTPVYRGEDLVPTGVEMEAYSVEDEGEGVSFHVFVYNIQPGVIIDYATGESRADPDYVVPESGTESE